MNIHTIYNTLANSRLRDVMDERGQRWTWQSGFLSQETAQGWIIYTEFVHPRHESRRPSKDKN